MSKNHKCSTCNLPIQWKGRVGNSPGKGWVHWSTLENHSEEPAPHNAFPSAKK